MRFTTRIRHYPGFTIIPRKGRFILVCDGCTARKSSKCLDVVGWMKKHEQHTEGR